MHRPVLETEFKTRFISVPPHGCLNVIVRKVAAKGLFLVELSSLIEGTFVFTLLCRERMLKGKVKEFTVRTREAPLGCSWSLCLPAPWSLPAAKNPKLTFPVSCSRLPLNRSR